MQHYADRLQAAIQNRNTAAVVGIDPILDRLPPALQPKTSNYQDGIASIEKFCCEVIELVHDVVPAVKVNLAFFEAFYEAGMAAYYRVVEYAHRNGLLVIGDGKRGDIGSTSNLYARAHLANPRDQDVNPERIPDAFTVTGYFGEASLHEFIECARDFGRGIYVIVRPSEPTADVIHEFGGTRPLYWHLGMLVAHLGSDSSLIGECGLSCVGAVVAPKEAKSTSSLRIAMGQTPFLVPGYGAQGATVEDCRACFRNNGDGAIVNASRSVIFSFSKPELRERFGDDWRAAIRFSARGFASEIGPSCRGQILA